MDLNEALNKGMIFGAGLDVFDKEPPDSNNPLLKNKKILITGATGGIGKAISILFAKNNGELLLTGRNKKKLIIFF